MLKTIFSQRRYAFLAMIISVSLFIVLSIISEYIYLDPYFIMDIPTDRMLGFILIISISVMSGVVLSINLYRIKSLQKSVKTIKSGFFGSIIGASAGACSCGPIGFAAVSTFGTVGGITTSFLTNYEIPLRIIALCILCYTFYMTKKSFSTECKIKN